MLLVVSVILLFACKKETNLAVNEEVKQKDRNAFESNLTGDYTQGKVQFGHGVALFEFDNVFMRLITLYDYEKSVNKYDNSKDYKNKYVLTFNGKRDNQGTFHHPFWDAFSYENIHPLDELTCESNFWPYDYYNNIRAIVMGQLGYRGSGNYPSNDITEFEASKIITFDFDEENQKFTKLSEFVKPSIYGGWSYKLIFKNYQLADNCIEFDICFEVSFDCGRCWETGTVHNKLCL